MEQQVFYRTVKIDGLSIFYREAGPKDAPTILLLHGLPSSARMFQPLLTRLADDYHLVAPDYPGYGIATGPIRSSLLSRCHVKRVLLVKSGGTQELRTK